MRAAGRRKDPSTDCPPSSAKGASALSLCLGRAVFLEGVCLTSSLRLNHLPPGSLLALGIMGVQCALPRGDAGLPP